MKDEKGCYYYPFPGNRRVRMYVRELEGQIEFRMANDQDPEMWEAHGWVPHEALRQAAALYTGKGFDPKRAYDIQVAQAVLKDGR